MGGRWTLTKLHARKCSRSERAPAGHVKVWRSRYETGQAPDTAVATHQYMEIARLVRVRRSVASKLPACDSASYAKKFRATGALTQYYQRGTMLPGENDLAQALIPGARAFALVEIVRVPHGSCPGGPQADTTSASDAASDAAPVAARFGAGGGGGGGGSGGKRAGELVIMRVPVRARIAPRLHALCNRRSDDCQFFSFNFTRLCVSEAAPAVPAALHVALRT